MLLFEKEYTTIDNNLGRIKRIREIGRKLNHLQMYEITINEKIRKHYFKDLSRYCRSYDKDLIVNKNMRSIVYKTGYNLLNWMNKVSLLCATHNVKNSQTHQQELHNCHGRIEEMILADKDKISEYCNWLKSTMNRNTSNRVTYHLN